MEAGEVPPEGAGGEARLEADHMSLWIELFYDLVFVAAILIFSAGVIHVHSSSGATWIVLVFAASWWVWFSTTVCANRFHMTDLVHRLLLLTQMLFVVLIAMEARVSVTGDSTYLVLEYGALLLTIALMYLRAERRGSPGSGYARRLAVVNLAASVCFFVAAVLPEAARLTVASVAVVLLVVPSVMILHRMEDFSTEDERHMVERMGAFTLIVFGESFVEVAVSLSHATISRVDVTALVFEFVLVFALFTSYFEDIPVAGLNQHRFGWWAGSHLVAQICIAGMAISVTKLVDVGSGHQIPHAEILRLTVPLATFYVALAATGWSTRRRPIGPLAVARLSTAGLVVVFGVATWYLSRIHLAEALPIFAAIAVLHAAYALHLRTGTEVVAVPPPPG